MRIRGGKKGKRSARNKQRGVYERQRVRTTRNKNRRAISREKRRAAAIEHPEIGSPSQLRRRQRRGFVVSNGKLVRLKTSNNEKGKQAE